MATGRTPNTETLGLDQAGVTLDSDGFVVVDAELRTSQPHVWAAGDVIGREHGSQMATPVGARQGRIVAENAFADARRRFDGTVIPRAIFTDPPIAVVGETEAQVRARHYPAVATDTVAGRRDRAILLTLVLTGRRRAEVLGLRTGDITLAGETAFYAYRGKGGKRGRRELPRPAYDAVRATLGDAGLELVTMDQAASLWQAGAGSRGISSGTFYGRFRRYLAAAGLAPTGIHVLRHTAAKLRREAGESVEAVSAFLDHSSLAVTTVYLRRLEGETDRTWADVAAAIGV